MNQTIKQILEDIETHYNELAQLRSKYLRLRGWQFTCQTVGSLWLWQKEINGKIYLMSENHAYSLQKELDDQGT